MASSPNTIFLSPHSNADPAFPRRVLCIQTQPPRGFRLVVAWALLGFASGSTIAQTPSPTVEPTLPSENDLPGQRSSSAPLPSENQLPNAPPRPSTNDEPLPSENELPTPLDTAVPDRRKDANANAADAIRGDSLERGELRPIFRLDDDAHTARINDLVALPGGDDAQPGRPPTFVSGGDDKNALIWSWNDRAASPLSHRKTLRWQVWRGPRGRIYRVAAHDRFIAMAGHGAMGGLGEIILHDADTGKFLRPLLGNNVHRQVVAGLDFAVGTPVRLASRDLEGRLVVWTRDENTGLFDHRTLVPSDRERFGPEVAALLTSDRDFVPVAMRNADEVWYADPIVNERDDAPESALQWWIHRQRIGNDKRERLGIGDDGQTPLAKRPTALKVSKGGQVAVAAVDDRVIVWKADRTDRLTVSGSAAVGGMIAAIAVSADGQSVFVLTDVAGKLNGKNVSRLQRYVVGDRSLKLVAETLPEGAGSALAVNGNRIVVGLFSNLRTYRWDQRGIVPTEEPPRSAAAGPKSGVRFVEGKDGAYRVLIAGSEEQPIQHFDLSDVRLLDTPQPDDAKAADAEADDAEIDDAQPAAANPGQKIPDVLRAIGELSIRLRNRNGNIEPLLYRGENLLVPLPIDPRRHGSVQCFRSWKSETGAEYIAVGTNGRNNVYVYRHPPDTEAPPRLVRQFRGHMAAVRGIDVSPDVRYLATAAEDATVMVWNLDDIDVATPMANRWGVQCDVQNGRCVASEVREEGPLYFRGVRRGDVIESLGWVDAQQQAQVTADPQTIAGRLLDLPFDALVKIEFSRSGVAQDPIQSFWAYQPLATLMVDRDREWAMWSPAGFYDASFNGHTRFGWQINRGVQQEPDYFRAAQMQQRLERPDVMRKLLAAGSLPSAMRSVYAFSTPLPGDAALVQQAATKPAIHWVSPNIEKILTDRVTPVTIAVDTPSGLDATEPQISIAGVSATNLRRLSDRESAAVDADLSPPDPDRHRRWYRADLHLPSQQALRAEVWASTRSGASSRLSVPLRTELPVPTRRPRMRILAVGVSQYEDPQITDLDFAADAAGRVAEAMSVACDSIYDVTVEVMTDGDGVRPLYRVLLDDAVRNLRDDVLPDDVLVLYLCGHGLRDRRTGRWYFVTADADYRRLMADQYAECLSTDDFGAVRDLPCRKLAILDSCHSGAVQIELRDDDLKSALRFFQRGSVLTLTASEGDQEAAEDRGRRLGRFTAAVIDSLSPQADADGDGWVNLDEWAESVIERVRSESRAAGSPQYPTRSPARLFRETRLPLMRAAPPVATSHRMIPATPAMASRR